MCRLAIRIHALTHRNFPVADNMRRWTNRSYSAEAPTAEKLQRHGWTIARTQRHAWRVPVSLAHSSTAIAIVFRNIVRSAMHIRKIESKSLSRPNGAEDKIGFSCCLSCACSRSIELINRIVPQHAWKIHFILLFRFVLVNCSEISLIMRWVCICNSFCCCCWCDFQAKSSGIFRSSSKFLLSHPTLIEFRCYSFAGYPNFEFRISLYNWAHDTVCNGAYRTGEIDSCPKSPETIINWTPMNDK